MPKTCKSKQKEIPKKELKISFINLQKEFKRLKRKTIIINNPIGHGFTCEIVITSHSLSYYSWQHVLPKLIPYIFHRKVTGPKNLSNKLNITITNKYRRILNTQIRNSKEGKDFFEELDKFHKQVILFTKNINQYILGKNKLALKDIYGFIAGTNVPCRFQDLINVVEYFKEKSEKTMIGKKAEVKINGETYSVLVERII